MLVLIDELKLQILRGNMAETKKSTRNHGNFFHIFQIQKDESERFSCRRRSNEEKFSYREIGIRYEW